MRVPSWKSRSLVEKFYHVAGGKKYSKIGCNQEGKGISFISPTSPLPKTAQLSAKRDLLSL